RHQGRVLSRDMLLDAVWGEMRFVTPRTVDACIRRIRKKIERDRTRPNFLKTLRGVGYRLDAAISWHVAPPNDLCDCAICNGAPRTYRAADRMRPANSPKKVLPESAGARPGGRRSRLQSKAELHS